MLLRCFHNLCKHDTHANLFPNFACAFLNLKFCMYIKQFGYLLPILSSGISVAIICYYFVVLVWTFVRNLSDMVPRGLADPSLNSNQQRSTSMVQHKTYSFHNMRKCSAVFWTLSTYVGLQYQICGRDCIAFSIPKSASFSSASVRIFRNSCRHAQSCRLSVSSHVVWLLRSVIGVIVCHKLNCIDSGGGRHDQIDEFFTDDTKIL